MHNRLKIALVVSSSLLATAVAGWLLLAPRGFVRITGEVGDEDVGELGRLDYGGIDTPEHYLRLHNRGRVSFFGASPAGSMFLRRSAGAEGQWTCGRVSGGEFDFRDGELFVDSVAVILDESKVQRGETLALAGIRVGESACEDTVISGAIDARFELSTVTTNEDELEIHLKSDAARILILAELDGPLGSSDEQMISYAWVRQTIHGEETERRIYVAGEGSRIVTRDGCATLELEDVSQPGVCRAGDGEGSIEVHW